MKKTLFLALLLVFYTHIAQTEAQPSFADFEKYQKTLDVKQIKERLTVLENNGACASFYKLTKDAFILYATPHDKQINNPEFILNLGSLPHPEPLKFIPTKNNQQPLVGLRVALDPGHVGGSLARTEERYIDLDIQTADGIKTVQFDEGTIAVATAHILEKMLTKLGATVMLTKSEPGQSVYHTDFETWYALYPDKSKSRSTVFRSVYNQLDLIARAEKINAFNPHIALMIHYNGGDREANGKNIPAFRNYSLTFIPGSFMASEMITPEARYEFVRLLVTDALQQSEALSRIIADELATELTVPVLDTKFYIPTQTIYRAPGVYARNLALTRRVHSTLCYGESLIQDNPDEAKRLAQTDFVMGDIVTSSRVAQVAYAYFKGILRYCNVPIDAN